MNLRVLTQRFGLKRAFAYLEKNPTENIPKLLNWFDRLDVTDHMLSKRTMVRRAIETKSNWYRLICSLWSDIHPNIRRKLLESFVINSAFLGTKRQEELRREHNCNIPFAILMDPTSACNLKCTGCWAAEYGHGLWMSLEELDDIIEQGKELGVYFYIYSGGEPLIRKNDIITLCKKHPDCVFLAFTNGKLIDDDFANSMLKVGNFAPAISIEGSESETDSRRGAGTYAAVMRAIKILKQKQLLFGLSLCYTSKNVETIGSEAYIDSIIELGAKFAWFFTYMPVGVNADTSLMVSAEQREYMYRQLRAFRESKPLFTMDFWNDGEYVNGCIAGGRSYLHINANGDIEPCAFIHYSDSNIRDKRLLDALKSPFFMAYRENQPFNENHLRPCPLLDNPEQLAKMVVSTGAKSTDIGAPEEVHTLCNKCFFASERWAKTADTLWSESHPEALKTGSTSNTDE